MPIYEYGCKNCGHVFEIIKNPSSLSWKEEKNKPVVCEECGAIKAFKLASSFKIGSSCLDTTKLTGYEDDDLTLGKIIDEGGIPYEYKDGIRKGETRRGERKKYIKGLKKRGKKYGFDPFSEKDEKLI